MVSLVGAGPGDVGLITVRGLEALRNADVILVDRLASPELLREAKEGAQIIDVGKRPRDPCQMRQAEINSLLVEHGLAGRRVVRLKGGDPYVFGRGGEEVEAMRRAGVPCEVIPGISSTVAGPAAAGIPVTHRGVSNGYAVFSGHEAPEGIAWPAAATIPTAVFLMAVERLPIIVAKLIEHGRDPATPVAIVSRATRSDQTVAIGTLSDILTKRDGVSAPAVIVVGAVVDLAWVIPPGDEE